MNKFLIFLIIAISFSACTSTKDLSKQNFFDKKWDLVSIKGLTEKENATFDKAGLKFASADSVYSGSNGCNMISGKYHLKGNKIKFDEALSTKRYCVGIDEETFMKVIRKTNTLKVKGHRLMLLKDKEILAVFADRKE
jgi:heat shock protein HslJ